MVVPIIFAVAGLAVGFLAGYALGKRGGQPADVTQLSPKNESESTQLEAHEEPEESQKQQAQQEQQGSPIPLDVLPVGDLDELEPLSPILTGENPTIDETDLVDALEVPQIPVPATAPEVTSPSLMTKPQSQPSSLDDKPEPPPEPPPPPGRSATPALATKPSAQPPPAPGSSSTPPAPTSPVAPATPKPSATPPKQEKLPAQSTKKNKSQPQEAPRRSTAADHGDQVSPFDWSPEQREAQRAQISRSDSRPGRTKPGQTKPSQTKPARTKPGTTKPAATKPGKPTTKSSTNRSAEERSRQQLKKPGPKPGESKGPNVLDALEVDPNLHRGAQETIRMVYLRFVPTAETTAAGLTETTVLDILEQDPYLNRGQRETIKTMYATYVRKKK